MPIVYEDGSVRQPPRRYGPPYLPMPSPFGPGDSRPPARGQELRQMIHSLLAATPPRSRGGAGLRFNPAMRLDASQVEDMRGAVRDIRIPMQRLIRGGFHPPFPGPWDDPRFRSPPPRRR